jgi:hypothetical protein
MEGETWVNLKRPLVIEEEPVKERGLRTMVGNMIELGFPILTALKLSLCHRWRTLSGSSICSARASLCLWRHPLVCAISFESRTDGYLLELISGDFGLSGARFSDSKMIFPNSKA